MRLVLPNIVIHHSFFTEYLEKAKSIIRVTHGQTHPLYSSNVMGLLEELNMHEKLKNFNQNSFKNSDSPSKSKLKKIRQEDNNHSDNRFKDVTDDNSSNNDGTGKTAAG